MASIEELRAVRLEKSRKLLEAGLEPYASSVSRTHTAKDAVAEFEDGLAVTVVGRVMAIRGQGAIRFFNIKDGTGTIQGCLKKGETPDEAMERFGDTVDAADFIEVSGTLFKTNTGQETVLVTDWKMLTKALRQLPDKWHGLEDEEERQRKRYLDAATDQAVFDRFVLRSNLIKAIRNFFDERGFMEVETPILQNQAGGAMARTFETFHNDYQMPMVLRISLELEHKIMMAAGYERIYEIGKNFRNEGSDPTHIQEFTMMEWYAAYASLEENIQWTETLLQRLAREVVGKETFTVFDKEGKETEVDFGGVWPRRSFGELLREHADFDMEHASLEDVRAEAVKWGMEKDAAAKAGRGNLLDHVFKKSARPKIVQPTFVLDYPSDLKPLAQQNGDGTARVAQLVIAGAEITNQYAELVDPVLERALLEAQAAAKEGGDEEAMSVDERFLVAMEHGMPPMTGFGMGIDRLVAIFAEQRNLRDVVFFPIMRPRRDE